MKTHIATDPIGPYESDFVINEVCEILDVIESGFETDFLRTVFSDTRRLFRGDYPGYKESDTPYHTWEHTQAVFLATARLLHGSKLLDGSVDAAMANICLTAALFHDTGLIPTSEEEAESGAVYMVGHEERSVVFMEGYLTAKHFSRADIDACRRMIRGTVLAEPFSEMRFPGDKVRKAAEILAAADLLAQMADRKYLTKLRYLFEEFETAGIEDYDSEWSLLEKTESFYRDVAAKRLKMLGPVSDFMRAHYKARWNMNIDPYDTSIQENLAYLRKMLDEADSSVENQIVS